jgi:hypothetical protein
VISEESVMTSDVDHDKLSALIGKMQGGFGGPFSVPTAGIAYRPRLFESLHSKCAARVSELAARTGLAERYVREWTLAQAANADINRVSYAHDLPRESGREGIPVLQRARPEPHPHIALGETLNAQEPSTPRTLVRAFVDRVVRLRRVLVEFAAAGGPLS